MQPRDLLSPFWLIMLLMVMPFYVTFTFVIYACRRAGRERARIQALHKMAHDEEQLLLKSQRQAIAREMALKQERERREKEALLLKEAQAGALSYHVDNDNDSDDALYMKDSRFLVPPKITTPANALALSNSPVSQRKPR